MTVRCRGALVVQISALRSGQRVIIQDWENGFGRQKSYNYSHQTPASPRPRCVHLTRLGSSQPLQQGRQPMGPRRQESGRLGRVRLWQQVSRLSALQGWVGWSRRSRLRYGGIADCTEPDSRVSRYQKEMIGARPGDLRSQPVRGRTRTYEIRKVAHTAG
jgi:hypothetical protein